VRKPSNSLPFQNNPRSPEKSQFKNLHSNYEKETEVEKLAQHAPSTMYQKLLHALLGLLLLLWINP
jgi:hypothetical protein